MRNESKRRSVARPIKEAMIYDSYPELKKELQYLELIRDSLLSLKSRMLQDRTEFRSRGGTVSTNDERIRFELNGQYIDLYTNEDDVSHLGTKFSFLKKGEQKLLWKALFATVRAGDPDVKIAVIDNWMDELKNCHLIAGTEVIKQELMEYADSIEELISGYPVREV